MNLFLLQTLALIDLEWVSHLFAQGGPVVIILFVMSVISLTVALFKLTQFLWHGVGRAGGVNIALDRWIKGDQKYAMKALGVRRNPTARVVTQAMSAIYNGIEESVIREDAEGAALQEFSELKSNLRVIEATSQMAPLLGLFGTVIGMIEAFQTLQSAGSDADPAALAGGIWVALLTTAVGLAVAIPASFILHWFEGRIDHERSQMEICLTRLLTAGPKRKSRERALRSETVLVSE